HQVISTSSSIQVTPTGQVCTSSTPVVVQTAVPPVTAVAPVTPATAPSSAAAQTNAGSVLGTQTALAKPKAKHANHGVLGTVTRVSGSTLPFTGFPLWVVLMVALGLIGTGVALRRRGSATWARPALSSRLSRCSSVPAILQRLRREFCFLDRLNRNRGRPLAQARNADRSQETGEQEEAARDDQQGEPGRHRRRERGSR